MQVYKTFLKILRSKISIACIYISIFLSIGISTAKSADTPADFTETRTSVVITDMDKSDASQQLCKYLEKTSNVTYGEADNGDKLDHLYYGEVSYYLTIKEGFGDKLGEGETENILSYSALDNSTSENLLNSRIDLYLTTAKAYVAAGYDSAEALSRSQEALSKKTEVTLLTEKKSGFEVIAPYFQFIPYIFVSVLMFSLCPVIMVLTGKEIKNRTLSAAMPNSRFLFEIALGAMTVITVLYTAIVVVVPLTVFGAEYSSDLGVAMLNSLAFTIVCAAIVLLVSTLIENEALVSLIGNVLGLGMSFLCGVFVPMQYLGDGVKRVGMFLPAYWFEVLNNSLAGVGDVYSKNLAAKCILIQLFFAAALFLATLAVMKTKEAKTGTAKQRAAVEA